MTEFQTILLDTFKSFNRICEQNGIQYFAFAGTALGAYRHHGFIPWDEDLDVLMHREDYDRFIQLAKPLAEEGKYAISYFGDGSFSEPFAKFYSTDYTIWENKNFPLIIGPWVDVFPLDLDDSQNPHTELSNSLKAARWGYMKTISDYSWQEIGYDFIHFRGLNGPVKLIKKTIMPIFRQHYLNRINQLTDEVRRIKEGDEYVMYGSFGRRFPREQFENGIEYLPFEDVQIPCPNPCTAHLETCFGPNYMTPPPPEQRVGHHFCYYMDLNERKTIKQIRSEMKNSLGKDPVLTLKGFRNGLKNKERY